MNEIRQRGSALHKRLDTFETLFLILDGVDRNLVQTGPAASPSFEKIWSELHFPVDRRRWACAWEFLIDEEMIVLELGGEAGPAWRLLSEGRVLLRELRLGAYSSFPTKNLEMPWNFDSPGTDGGLRAWLS